MHRLIDETGLRKTDEVFFRSARTPRLDSCIKRFMASIEKRDQTIRDFGRQWTTYTENEGFYASQEMLADILEPLYPVSHLEGVTAVEIGSGSGRIARMFLGAGVRKLYALEPSDAITTLAANTGDFSDRIELLHMRGDELPPVEADLVASIGVVHHIPDPDPVVRAAWNALKPSGQILLWLYGKEGNELYLSVVEPLRAVSSRLPHVLLAALVHTLNVAAGLYLFLARRLPLPMHSYMTNVFGRFDYRTRYLAIYDQLNPAHAKYYLEQEAIDLLTRNGFINVRAFHRHGYSWSVIGERPA